MSASFLWSVSQHRAPHTGGAQQILVEGREGAGREEGMLVGRLLGAPPHPSLTSLSPFLTGLTTNTQLYDVRIHLGPIYHGDHQLLPQSCSQMCPEAG